MLFLESNNFHAKREDLEAILRRVDHDGNQRISFDEFCEITSVNEQKLNEHELGGDFKIAEKKK